MIRAAAIAALSLAVPAWAQEPDPRIASTAVLDANAVLTDAPPPPLELSVQTPITFGRVAIPNMIAPDTVCRYEVTSNGFTSGGQFSEISGTTVRAGTPGTATRSGCQFATTPSVGIVQIACQRGLTVQYRFDYQGGGFKGAVFTRVANQGPGVVVPSFAEGAQRVFLAANSTSFPCTPNQETGRALILVSGQLDVSNIASLPRDSALKVGSVRIDVNY